VADLKRLVAGASGVPAADQRLCFRGVPLGAREDPGTALAAARTEQRALKKTQKGEKKTTSAQSAPDDGGGDDGAAAAAAAWALGDGAVLGALRGLGDGDAIGLVLDGNPAQDHAPVHLQRRNQCLSGGGDGGDRGGGVLALGAPLPVHPVLAELHRAGGCSADDARAWHFNPGTLRPHGWAVATTEAGVPVRDQGDARTRIGI